MPTKIKVRAYKVHAPCPPNSSIETLLLRRGAILQRKTNEIPNSLVPKCDLVSKYEAV